MNIQIKTTNLNLTKDITDYVYKKLTPFDDLIASQQDTSDILTHVELAHAKEHSKGSFFRVEVTMRLKGPDVRAVSEKNELFTAIDDVRDQVDRMLSQRKDKRHNILKKGASFIKRMMRLQDNSRE